MAECSGIANINLNNKVLDYLVLDTHWPVPGVEESFGPVDGSTAVSLTSFLTDSLMLDEVMLEMNKKIFFFIKSLDKFKAFYVYM